MIKTIDIVMTAAFRPEILSQTLFSLKRNLIWDGKFRLIIDIAPVPAVEESLVVPTQCSLVNLAKSYFPCTLSRMLLDSPQADALKWTWKNATSDYILQWEDDWELTKKVDLEKMLTCFLPKTGMMYFDRAGKSVLDYSGYVGAFRLRSNNVWERIKGKSLGGPPALLKREYAHRALSFVDGTTCLDLLAARTDVQEFLSEWEIAVYLGEHGQASLVKDIGKAWKKEQGITMKKNTKRGVTWSR